MSARRACVTGGSSPPQSSRGFRVLRARDVVADHPPEVLIGSLTGYLALYGFLLIAYIGSLNYLSSNPPRSAVLLHEYHLSSTTAESDVK